MIKPEDEKKPFRKSHTTEPHKRAGGQADEQTAPADKCRCNLQDDGLVVRAREAGAI